MNIYTVYRLSHILYKKRVPFLPQLIKYLLRILFGCVIPYKAQIGSGTKFGYQGLGVVIHSKCVIGENCNISQGVTIGGTSKKADVPKLGNNVYVGAGAKIIGPITVGNNVVIGANAVVINDIPDNSLVVGIPAKIIKNNINITNYK